MFEIDVLGSKHGDCLVVNFGDSQAPKRILIDGGPPGVYRRFLRPYLRALKAQAGGHEPPEFELAMVSHIDQDHIKGLLELTDEMIEEEDSFRDPARIKRFWFNSFPDLTGGSETAALTATASAVAASEDAGGIAPFEALVGSDGRAAHILAGLGQGRSLRNNLETLGLDGNRPFNNSLVMAGKSATFEGMRITIIGPDKDRLTDLQQDWNPNLDPSEIAAMTDRSVANLSSIVALLEFEGKSLLLTGDARGDDILKWLEDAGLKQPNHPFHVDVFKAAHHGSDNNVDPEFFKALTSDIYIYCGDGKHDNPEPATLRMMREARDGETYEVIFSSFVRMEHSHKQEDFERELRLLNDAGIDVDARDNDELKITVKLS